MSDRPVGDILDGLGVTLDLDDGDLVVSAVVIAKIIGESQREPAVAIGVDESCTWLDQFALVKRADQIVSAPGEVGDL